MIGKKARLAIVAVLDDVHGDYRQRRTGFAGHGTPPCEGFTRLEYWEQILSDPVSCVLKGDRILPDGTVKLVLHRLPVLCAYLEHGLGDPPQ
ncbi:MAG: hypothetical protein WAL83_00625 [Arenicellales bacterium]